MKITHLRWWMIGLIFLATVINYVDRQTVSVLKKSITDDLGLSNPDYAAVQNAFLIAYAISQMLSGRLYDAVGTRIGFTISIVVWSIAAAAHAAASTADELRLLALRARLRRGRQLAGGREGDRRVVPRPGARARHGHLQHRRRGRRRAVSAAHRLAGHHLGLAADVRHHRRCWASAGSCCGSSSTAGRRSTRGSRSEERAYILEGRETAAAPGAAGEAWRPGWLELLRYRQVWAVVVARFLTDPIWWLYVFWLPSYFQEARGFSLQQIGWSAWFPFLAGGLGALTGGWASGHLIDARLEPRPGAQDRDDGRRAARFPRASSRCAPRARTRRSPGWGSCSSASRSGSTTC